MQEFEDEAYFGGIELGCGFVEAASAAEIRENFAAGAVVKLQARRVSCGFAKAAFRKSGNEGNGARRCSRETYKHIQRVMVLETSNHSGYERVAGYYSKYIPFVANMLDLLEFDDCAIQMSDTTRCACAAAGAHRQPSVVPSARTPCLRHRL